MKPDPKADELKKMKRLYREGLSYKDVGAAVGKSHGYAFYMLKEAGVKSRPCSADRPMPKHSLARYRRGCRCAVCRTANNDAHRRLIGRTPPNHGLSGYVNYACRCEVCKEAGAAAQRGD